MILITFFKRVLKQNIYIKISICGNSRLMSVKPLPGLYQSVGPDFWRIHLLSVEVDMVYQIQQVFPDSKPGIRNTYATICNLIVYVNVDYWMAISIIRYNQKNELVILSIVNSLYTSSCTCFLSYDYHLNVIILALNKNTILQNFEWLDWKLKNMCKYTFQQ